MEAGKDDVMTIKLIGAVLVILGCGGFGFYIAASQKTQEQTLKQLVRVLDYIACELQYRMTPLPQLCRQVALECNGLLRHLFDAMATELEMQVAPDVDVCMKTVLGRFSDVPKYTHEIMQKLGRSLGRFDIEGQLKDLESIRSECRIKLLQIGENFEVKIRTYKTIGLCAGAALVILFI